MIGESVAHYRILEKVGAGGMGVVYRAEDSRLGRQVVLKFLPEGASRDSLRLERFRREAKAASSLNHPNICTLHDIGEHGGRPYIVMEYLEGTLLGAVIGEGGLEPGQIVDFATQICSGLECAHAKGIVHRDIKPDNIFLVHGKQAKILDFGLAKMAHIDSRPVDPSARTLTQDLALTHVGSTLGTLSYMSPEQALGRDVDHRTDLFSFGAVLYEMVTGRRAFPGSTAAEIFDAILHRTPAPLPQGPTRLAAMEPVITKALEKDRNLRYQSASELQADLDRAQRQHHTTDARPGNAVDSSDGRRVVAILPFNLLAGKEEDAFLSLALAEAVAHELSSRPELLVRPTSAVLRYDPRQADPQQVAKDLGAEVVVEGSVQKQGPNLRVQVRAWESARRSTLLSVKIDGSVDDLFGLQDRTAEALSGGLGMHEDSSSREPPTRHPRAYEMFLRASERMLAYNEVDCRRAIELLRSTVALDAQFADAWAKLSIALVDMGALFQPGPHWYMEAEEAATRALHLAPENVKAWTARGRILWSPAHQFENAEALRILKRACSHPSHPSEAPLWYGSVLAHVGLHREARELADQLLENQTHEQMARLVKSEVAGWDGDAGTFYDVLSQAVRADPSFVYSYLFLPVPLSYLDRLAEAERAIEQARTIHGADSMFLAGEALLWAKRGERERALEILERAEQHKRSVSHLHHYQHYGACAYALVGEHHKAVELLSGAVTTGFPNYPAFTKDPHFQAMHEMSEFRDLLRRVRPLWDEFKAEFGKSPGR